MSQISKMRKVHIIIKGRVQGVFFRATAREVANELGIDGWVKNTIEGHVEILAAGEEEKLEKFIQWCRRGPSKAKVEEIKIEETDLSAAKGFTVIR
jgi:acylphosphatase